MQVYVYHWHILRGEEECTTHQCKNIVSRESRRIFTEMMKRILEMTQTIHHCGLKLYTEATVVSYISYTYTSQSWFASG